jgi:hypothetical protein
MPDSDVPARFSQHTGGGPLYGRRPLTAPAPVLDGRTSGDRGRGFDVRRGLFSATFHMFTLRLARDGTLRLSAF